MAIGNNCCSMSIVVFFYLGQLICVIGMPDYKGDLFGVTGSSKSTILKR